MGRAAGRGEDEKSSMSMRSLIASRSDKVSPYACPTPCPLRLYGLLSVLCPVPSTDGSALPGSVFAVCSTDARVTCDAVCSAGVGHAATITTMLLHVSSAVFSTDVGYDGTGILLCMCDAVFSTDWGVLVPGARSVPTNA
eukprot:2747810-Rhodomonas_salina.1